MFISCDFSRCAQREEVVYILHDTSNIDVGKDADIKSEVRVWQGASPQDSRLDEERNVRIVSFLVDRNKKYFCIRKDPVSLNRNVQIAIAK